MLERLTPAGMKDWEPVPVGVREGVGEAVRVAVPVAVAVRCGDPLT